VIDILEADYNLALKEIFGRRLLHEKFGTLGDTEDGFRKNRSTIRTLIHNKIINDYNKRRRIDNFVGLTNISECFDRIVAPIISLLNRRNGCPKEAVTMHASTLNKARYYLKTKHGISKNYYSHTSETPIHGNGQGAGYSPSHWCQQSAMLFDLYAELNKNGSTMSSPTNDLQITLPLTAFTDDTNLLGNDDECKLSMEQLTAQAQTSFTTWNELLNAAGHFMELEKCACYLAAWDFQEDGYAFTKEPSEIKQDITVKDIHGGKERIQILPCTTSQKLLGVMRNPIGNQQDEIKRLEVKSNKIAARLNVHSISRIEAKMAYESFYLPAMRYSLSITSINQIDLEKVQRNVTSSVIVAMGYNRNFQEKWYSDLGNTKALDYDTYTTSKAPTASVY
jgi:hypothetical protein